MKSLISERASLLCIGACAATVLLGAGTGEAQSTQTQISRPEVRTARPLSAVFVPAPQRIVINRRAIAAAVESAYLKRLTDGFFRH